MRIVISAGEMSGDLLGAQLLESLKTLLPETTWHGIRGPHLRSKGLDTLFLTENLSVMGVKDVIFNLPTIQRGFNALLTWILQKSPDAVITIDYPGFHLRLHRILRKKGYSGKLIHYVSPSVWAWKKERIEQMAKTLDLLLLIFPFEEKHFKRSGLKTFYVGHPLKEVMPPLNPKKRDTDLLLFFPGSREAEIAYHLPIQLEVADLWKINYPDARFGISLCHENLKPFFEKLIQKMKPHLNSSITLFSSHERYDLMQKGHLALAKSGTVNLELAWTETPTVMMYKLSWLDYLLVKYWFDIKISHVSIVNLVAEKTVFPEWVHRKISPQSLFISLEKLNSPEHYEQCQRESRTVWKKLTLPNMKSSLAAAKSILEIL